MQYGYYVKGVFTADAGPSLVIRGRDVNDIVKTHLPKSIELGLYAFCFAIIVGVPLGMLAALGTTRRSTTAPCSSRTSSTRCRASSSRPC